MIEYSHLRAANFERDKEWVQDVKMPNAFWGVELIGEVGEACNIIKKIEREKLGLRGSRATIEQLGQELADCYIVADLVAIAMKLPIIHIEYDLTESCHDTNLELSLELGCCCGLTLESIKLCKYNDDIHSYGLNSNLQALVEQLFLIAFRYGIDLRKATQDKFNATSEKMGLQTRLVF